MYKCLGSLLGSGHTPRFTYISRILNDILHFVQPEKRPVVQSDPCCSLYVGSWSAVSLLPIKNDPAEIPMSRLFADQLGESPCFDNTEANNCGAELRLVQWLQVSSKHFHHILCTAIVQWAHSIQRHAEGWTADFYYYYWQKLNFMYPVASRSALGPTYFSVREHQGPLLAGRWPEHEAEVTWLLSTRLFVLCLCTFWGQVYVKVIRVSDPRSRALWNRWNWGFQHRMGHWYLFTCFCGEALLYEETDHACENFWAKVQIGL
jgi:hypothetical protein